jgi:hypothetical protein
MKPVHLAILATALLLPAVASAHPAPFYHRHVHRPPAVHVAPPPPRAVVVRPAPVVVEVEAPAPPPEPAPEYFGSPFSIGVRVLGIGTEGYKLGLSDFENPMMGGAGLQLRSRVSPWFGIEAGLDFLGGQDGDYAQFQVPFTLSFMAHLFPSSRIQPYLLAGLGVQYTQLDYMDGQFSTDIVEGVGQAGAGVEIWLTRHLAVSADVRFIGLFRSQAAAQELQWECEASGAGAFCNQIGNGLLDDRFNGAIQFMAGLSYGF